MGALLPEPEGGAGMNAETALAAARQETTVLRGVLEAIQDALIAATTRLEALEAQVGSTIAAPAGEPSPRPQWKLPGWTPDVRRDAVTGEAIRGRREALGISQAAVAHAAHCSRGLVAEVERGKRRSAQTLAHLASVLDKLEQQARRN